MSRVQANCPNCGAAVEFLWSAAVQTTCGFCRSILVRHDVTLRKVGEFSDLPDNSSPIQMQTEGVYQKKAFVVVGRIIYEYDRGSWNEWHLAFNDGTSGWLSDAQAEYAVSFLRNPPGELPANDKIERGQVYSWFGQAFHVTTITLAEYKGVEGELPFEYWDKQQIPFVDLRTGDARFATLDYSEAKPLLFVGESVSFTDLKLKNVRQFEGW
jgi:hypothetical protein